VSKGTAIANFKQGTAPYLELELDGSEVIPHISLTSLDTSQCDSSLMTGSAELLSSSCFAGCTFCIKRRLSVPLLIVAVMMGREVKGNHKPVLDVPVSDDTTGPIHVT
jgi:hypothetical protein